MNSEAYLYTHTHQCHNNIQKEKGNNPDSREMQLNLIDACRLLETAYREYYMCDLCFDKAPYTGLEEDDDKCLKAWRLFACVLIGAAV